MDDTPYYTFHESDDRLKNFINTIRLIVSGMRKFDMLQFEERVTRVKQVTAILTKHPEWDNGNRKRLNSKDHHNPHSWSGDTLIQNVDLHACWEDEEKTANTLLLCDGLYNKGDCYFEKDSRQSSTGYITMLKPRDHRVHVFPSELSCVSAVDSGSGSRIVRNGISGKTNRSWVSVG